MKKTYLALALCAISIGMMCFHTSHAQEPSAFQLVEFATIRWDGKDNSFVTRPNGKVEKLKILFDRFPRANGVDERVYYMNVAMNAMAKEGYDFAGMTSEQIVMRRTISR